MKRFRLPISLPATVLLFIAGSALLTGCEEKTLYTHEELYGSQLLLNADWQGNSPTADALDIRLRSLTAGIDADTTFRLASGSHTQFPLLEARYEVTALHEAENVGFDGECFRLTTGADGLPPEPGPFSAGTGTVDVPAQQLQAYALKLYPFTRLLKFSFRMDSEARQRLAGLDATLSGIAASRCLADRSTTRDEAVSIGIEVRQESGTEASPAATSIQNEGTSIRSDEDNLFYTGSHRLLGIHTAARQVLTLTLHYTNGESEALTQDLSTQLQGFNDGTSGSDPDELTLTARISFAGQAGASATITDWAPGTDSDLDAGNKE